MKRLEKGLARIEFFAVRQEVEKLLAAGYSIKLAYEDLKEKGKITMSYQAFYRNLKPVKKTGAKEGSAAPVTGKQVSRMGRRLIMKKIPTRTISSDI